MPSSRMPSGRVAPGANRGQPSNSKGGNWWQSPFCGSHTGGRVNAQAAVLHTSHASVRPQRVEDLQAREVPFVFRDNHAMIRLGDGGNDHVERAAGPLRQRRERDAVSVARNDGEDRGLPRDVACCVDGGIVLALPGVLRHGGGAVWRHQYPFFNSFTQAERQCVYTTVLPCLSEPCRRSRP